MTEKLQNAEEKEKDALQKLEMLQQSMLMMLQDNNSKPRRRSRFNEEIDEPVDTSSKSLLSVPNGHVRHQSDYLMIPPKLNFSRTRAKSVSSF